MLILVANSWGAPFQLELRAGDVAKWQALALRAGGHEFKPWHGTTTQRHLEPATPKGAEHWDSTAHPSQHRNRDITEHPKQLSACTLVGIITNSKGEEEDESTGTGTSGLNMHIASIILSFNYRAAAGEQEVIRNAGCVSLLEFLYPSPEPSSKAMRGYLHEWMVLFL